MHIVFRLLVNAVEWLWPSEPDMTHFPKRKIFGRMLDNCYLGCGKPEEWPMGEPGTGRVKEQTNGHN